MRKKNSQKLVIGVLFLSVFFLGFFQNLNISYAQENEETVNLSNNFILNELSEHNSTGESVDSFDISLPSSEWNVTNIDVEFTDINFTRQSFIIEDTYRGYDEAIKKTDINARSVQLITSRPTRIFGIKVHGRTQSALPLDDVNISIRGYNQSINAPNNTFYWTQKINMSGTVPQWWNQSISTYIDLSPGNYSLVINVVDTQLKPAKYYWSYNDLYPKDPNLYVSYYNVDNGNWSLGYQGSPFLYILDQQVIEDFYPEEFNMTAEINGLSHKIINGTGSGMGNLSLAFTNYTPLTDTLNIPININEPYTFDFNYSYNINLFKEFPTSGSVIINNETSENEWSVMFFVSRTDGNYSVKFIAPDSWNNLLVFKEGSDITTKGNVSIDGQIVTISNNTIPYVGIQWEIRATSPKVDFELDTPITEWNAGSLLQFGLIAPALYGNYTFILYNHVGFLKTENSTEYSQGDPPIFTYPIDAGEISGEWTAYIFWNNKTDAGVETQMFTISSTTLISGGGGGGGGGGSTTVTGLDPLLVLTISIIIIVAIAGSLTSYQMVKRLKRKRDLQMQKLHNKVMDSLNLNYIMISENSSGLNVFEQFFGGIEIDPTLISGFLSAIRSFGIELTGTFQQSQTIKLEFQNSKILMNEFRHFRLILIMGENPSDDFIESINNLSYDIEKEYGELIRDFDGSLTEFTGIGKLIEQHLNVSFLFPLKVISSGETKFTPAESLVFNKAREIMKQNNLGYIFTSFLMDDQIYEPKRIKAIFGLIEKGIFQPIHLEDQNFKN